MSVTISATGSILNLTFSDGRLMPIPMVNIQRMDLIGNDVFIYQTILENNERVYPQNPDVIKLDYTQVTPSYGSALLLIEALVELISIGLDGGGGVPGDLTAGNIITSANYFSPDDFTATYTSGTTITLSSTPFTITSEQIKYIFLVTAAGDAKWYGNGVDDVYFTISSNVITIHGVTDPFTTGDIYEVGIRGQRKPFDVSTDSDKITNINPEWAHYKEDPNYSETLSATAKSYYVIPLKSFKGGSVTFRLTTGAGSTAVLKSYLTNDPDENTSTITIANWHDDSADSLGAASIACAAGVTTDQVIHFDTNYGCQYFLLEVDYTHSANSTLTINSYIN